jgi:predicted RNA binding protein YcfA (HicA-like mRNA interferase family)
VKVREVIRLLEHEGWVLIVTRGSHRQFKHPVKPGRVTVSGNLGDDMPKGTFSSVRRQAGLKRGGS